MAVAAECAAVVLEADSVVEADSMVVADSVVVAALEASDSGAVSAALAAALDSAGDSELFRSTLFMAAMDTTIRFSTIPIRLPILLIPTLIPLTVRAAQR